MMWVFYPSKPIKSVGQEKIYQSNLTIKISRDSPTPKELKESTF